MERSNRRAKWGIAMGLLAFAAVAQSQSNPYQKGPDPTSALLNATSGPFAVATSTVSSLAANGFGGGTIYYPTDTGSYAVLAISPGFTATQSSIAWLGRRIATHGFVVITIDTNSTLDQPPSRATQLIAALRHVTDLSNSTVRSRVDATRRGVSGHSMGGGGSLLAARDNPSLRAAVPLTAWSTTKTFSRVQVPTLVVGAENDSIASVASHSIPFGTFRSDDTGKLIIDEQTRLNMEALLARTDPDELSKIQETITQNLPSTAAAQASALLDRYQNYSKAQRQAYPPGEAPATEEAALAELGGLHALRVAHFGSETARALYGGEEALTRSLIELMRLEKDQSLTMEEKAARAQQLYDTLPELSRVQRSD